MGQARRNPLGKKVRAKVTSPMVKDTKRGKRASGAAPTTPPCGVPARMIFVDHAIVVEFERLLLPLNPNPLAKPRRRADVGLSLSPVPHLLLQQAPPRARRASQLALNCLSCCEAEENQRGPRTGSANLLHFVPSARKQERMSVQTSCQQAALWNFRSSGNSECSQCTQYRVGITAHASKS
jgi:hypothetical protein